MCIQRTAYSCKHTLLRQLPCGHGKVSKGRRSCFSFGTAPTEPCHRRYDWKMNEPCPKCRKALEEALEARELRSRGYQPPSLQAPIPRGQHLERRFFTAPGLSPYTGTRALRPDSYLEPGVNADVAKLPGHYELPTSLLSGRGPRPDSYIEPEVNAEVENLPGHYDLPRSMLRTRRPRADSYNDYSLNAELASLPGHYAMPSQQVVSRTPTQANRPLLSVRRRGRSPTPLSISSQYPGQYMQGDTAVSPVSIGDADSRAVSPMSTTAYVRAQSRQRSRAPYY